MTGRLAPVLVTLALAATPALVRAQEAPPPIPSSYEQHRQLTLQRLDREEAAREAKRRSRMIEQTGAGQAGGQDAGLDLSLSVSTKQLGSLALTGLAGYAAASALYVGTEPAFGGDGGGGGGGAGSGTGSTSTSTATQ